MSYDVLETQIRALPFVLCLMKKRMNYVLAVD